MPSVKIIITDFDGVILESEEAKDRGFKKCFSIFGQDSDAILNYHLSNKNLTRYQKFEYIFESILNRKYTSSVKKWISERCNNCIYDEVIKCQEIPGIINFFNACANYVSIYVVSATPVDQLKRVVKKKKYQGLFKELLSIPPSKSEIIACLLDQHNAQGKEAVYIGDRNSDLIAAANNHVLFIARENGQEFTGPRIHQIKNFSNWEKFTIVDKLKKKITIEQHRAFKE